MNQEQTVVTAIIMAVMIFTIARAKKNYLFLMEYLSVGRVIGKTIISASTAISKSTFMPRSMAAIKIMIGTKII